MTETQVSPTLPPVLQAKLDWMHRPQPAAAAQPMAPADVLLAHRAFDALAREIGHDVLDAFRLTTTERVTPSGIVIFALHADWLAEPLIVGMRLRMDDSWAISYQWRDQHWSTLEGWLLAWEAARTDYAPTVTVGPVS